MIEPNQAVENMVAYIVQYKKNKATHDVSLVDIIVPSKKDVHSRKNPAGHLSQIVVKIRVAFRFVRLKSPMEQRDFERKKSSGREIIAWAETDYNNTTRNN